MRKRRTNGQSSTDLLLDTICNTFGGVVFISLLIVVLLNASSKNASSRVPDQPLRSQFLREENRRKELTRELDRLREAVAEQAEITEIIPAEQILKLADQIEDLKRNEAGLVAGTSKVVGGISDTQEKINDLALDAAKRQTELEEARNQLEQLKRKIEIAVEQNSREAVIPKVVMSTKPPQAFFLKGGRLYGPRSLADGSLNQAEFQIVESDGEKILVERSGAGTKVDPTGKQNRPLRNTLDDDRLKAFYAKLFVWPDSYEHVEAVRAILDDLDIRCQIEPCEAETIVVFSSDVQSGPAPVQ